MSWPWKPPRQTPWQTPFPLPRDTAEALLAEGGCDNFGLLSERYLAYGEDRDRLHLLRELVDRRALVADFSHWQELIAAHQARWQRRATALGAVTLRARPEWRVIVGLKTNTLLESGIMLHPIYGFPIIPSSALKGVCRQYAEKVLERPVAELEHRLGWADDEDGQRGDLIFLDGVPETPPPLERDVINPIFGAYYREDGTPPADYLSPQPNFFLTIGSGDVYWFGVASIEGNAQTAEQGAQWLRGALEELGVGAKTCAGYGYWQVEEPIHRS